MTEVREQRSDIAKAGSGMSKKTGFAFGAMLLALSFPAKAQQAQKVPRIGYLTASSASSQASRLDAFRQGLHELGYVEGKNIVIEYRYAEGLDRVPALAAELVGLKVDVIVTGGTGASRAAKEATHTIPIVMAQEGDPVGSGSVASLARPGGSVTGLSTLSPEISGKQLELLKEIVPQLYRVAVIGSSTDPEHPTSVKRDRTGGRGAEGAAAIPRRTRS